jgi:hypothetical protein
VSVHRAIARSLGVLALTGPIAASLVLASVSSASAADSDFSSPNAGQVFTGSQASVTVQASVPACPKNVFGCTSTPTTTLSVSSAAQSVPSASKVAKTSAQTIAVTVPANAVNGSWTATLSGGNTGTRTFTINYNPNTPSAFSASGSGARDVSFSWNKGSEPDLTGYTLTDGAGNVIDSNITTSSAGCSSSSRCSYGLYYASDHPGTFDYQLIAKRSAAGGGTLSSTPTPSAQATLTAPPKPTPPPTTQPTPDPGGSPAPGGTTGGGPPSGSTGGTTPGGTSGGSSGGHIGNPGPKPTLPPNAANPVIAQRRAFALTFNAFSPSLGIPKLPPLPSTALPSLEQPLPLGTYKPSLPYSPKSETTKTTSVLTQPIHFVTNVLDSKQLAKSIAGALILLLVGAHLRRFLGTHVEE